MGPVTPPGPTPGGGSGTVKKVASANASVTVTTPTGPTVGVEVATSPKLGGAAAATFADHRRDRRRCQGLWKDRDYLNRKDPQWAHWKSC